MMLKSDVKFEEKMIFSSKHDLRNLVDFNASSGKSEKFHFDLLLLSIAYKVSALISTVELSLVTLRKDPNFEEKLTFCLKNNIRNFNESSGKSENLHFDWLLLQKKCNI